MLVESFSSAKSEGGVFGLKNRMEGRIVQKSAKSPKGHFCLPSNLTSIRALM